MVFALSCSAGLPSACVQSAAWVGMFVTFAREAPLTESISKTFDGRHPCGLCKVVQREESSKKKHDILRSTLKFELAMPECEEFVFPQMSSPRWAAVAARGDGFRREPPSPPPKVG